MEKQASAAFASSEHTVWIWIITGVLLVCGAGIGAGSLALLKVTTQVQLPTGSQSVPATR